MALIKCPECGQQVSDKAAVCPHCGVAIAGNPEIAARGAAAVSKTAKPAVKSEKQGKNNRATIYVVAAVIALAIVAVGFYYYNNVESDNEMEAYENAMACNEPAIMENYLDMYADAPQAHRDSVMAHLAILRKGETDWSDALVNNSRMAFENYLRTYPTSIHKTEALLKIDSIDWTVAVKADNADAYQKYALAHPDGEHIDEANAKIEQKAKTALNDEEKLKVTNVLTAFFMALGANDEDDLTMTIDVVLNSFLHKAGATKMDVISYMHRIHNPEDISSITFRMNNDWKIEKIDLGTDDCSYAVDFSVDEKIERTDTSKETFCSYKVSAKVSAAGKITDLNMKKGVME